VCTVWRLLFEYIYIYIYIFVHTNICYCVRSLMTHLLILLDPPLFKKMEGLTHQHKPSVSPYIFLLQNVIEFKLSVL